MYIGRVGVMICAKPKPDAAAENQAHSSSRDASSSCIVLCKRQLFKAKHLSRIDSTYLSEILLVYDRVNLIEPVTTDHDHVRILRCLPTLITCVCTLTISQVNHLVHSK